MIEGKDKKRAERGEVIKKVAEALFIRPLTLDEICKETKQTKQSVHAALKKLENNGVIKKDNRFNMIDGEIELVYYHLYNPKYVSSDHIKTLLKNLKDESISIEVKKIISEEFSSLATQCFIPQITFLSDIKDLLKKEELKACFPHLLDVCLRISSHSGKWNRYSENLEKLKSLEEDVYNLCKDSLNDAATFNRCFHFLIYIESEKLENLIMEMTKELDDKKFHLANLKWIVDNMSIKSRENITKKLIELTKKHPESTKRMRYLLGYEPQNTLATKPRIF